MNYKIIREILTEYREGISLETLNEAIKEKNLKKVNLKKLLNKTKLFKINNILFLKSAFLKHKNEFFMEFSDFLDGKINDKKVKNDVISLYIIYISDNLFYNWIKTPLERKIIIFELLFNFIIKTRNTSDELKKYLNNLIDFYVLTSINLIMLAKTYKDNIDKFLKVINRIEPYEITLKKHLYDIFTKPDILIKRLDYYKKEFDIVQNKIKKIFNNEFKIILSYSKILFKRVIKNEIMNFNILSLLTRYNYNSLYEWIIYLFDEEIKPARNLFKDLDI
ncbi:MAG: hypothetical protein JXB50_00040 [Spirochaetes bacterium]|nr:hypothetical protein [Spirochaetota bacterium]